MSRPDIVKRLRAVTHDWDDYLDAANEIEQLRKVLRKMMRDWDKREGWIAPETWARARKLSTGDKTP